MGRDWDNWVEQIEISSKRLFQDMGKWIGDVGTVVGGSSKPRSTSNQAQVSPRPATSPSQNSRLLGLLLLIGALLILLLGVLPTNGAGLILIPLGILGVGVTLLVVGARQQQLSSGTPTQGLNPPAQTEVLAPLSQMATMPRLVYTIDVPRNSEWNSTQATSFIKQLTFAFPQLVLQITATSEAIRWQLLDLSESTEMEMVEQIVRASYPQAVVTATEWTAPSVSPVFYRYVCFYQQAAMFVAPIQYLADLKAFDPLTALTQALSSLQVGERVTFTLALNGVAQDAHKQGQKLITQSTIHPLQLFSREGIGDALGKVITGTDRMQKYVHQDQHVFETKLRETLFKTAVLVQVDSPNYDRILSLLALVDNELAHYTRMPYNALQWVERAPQSYTQLIDSPEKEVTSSALFVAHAWTQNVQGDCPPDLILDPRELAALWHLPDEGFSAPRIQWASTMAEVAEKVARNQAGTLLGTGKYQGKVTEIRLPLPDRITHLNIVGKTGTGKSTLMHHLIHQDIADGRGVAVLDPHGKLVSDILRTSIPVGREQDVVIIDLANDAYPPPLNPLVGAKDYSSTLKMVSIIDRMFEGTEESARMAGYLRAALLPLQSEKHATMRDVTRLFMDAVYRQHCLKAVDDPETQDFWDYHYNPSSPALQRQIAEPIIIRVRPFYANPTLYPVLCHPDTLNFRQLIEENKIILISLALDEERVPEQERNLVGALLMSRLQMSGMKERAERTDPFFIYVDEVQKFVTTSLSDVLSEARKFGLALVTANQFLDQLTGKTLEAVMGNVGTTIVFRCSPDDGQTLAAYMNPPFKARDLVDLDRFRAVTKMQIAGETQPAFSLQTMSPLPVPQDGAAREQYLRELSVATYTPKSRAEVQAWLRERYGRGKSGEPVDSPPSEDQPQFFDPT